MRAGISWIWPLIGFFSLLALWEAVIAGFQVRPFIAPDPVTVGRFITPLWQLLHYIGMGPRAAETLHRLLILPDGQSPVSAMRVDEQPAAQEAGRTLDLPLP